jgi:hypothetical protein
VRGTLGVWRPRPMSLRTLLPVAVSSTENCLLVCSMAPMSTGCSIAGRLASTCTVATPLDSFRSGARSPRRALTPSPGAIAVTILAWAFVDDRRRHERPFPTAAVPGDMTGERPGSLRYAHAYHLAQRCLSQVPF